MTHIFRSRSLSSADTEARVLASDRISCSWLIVCCSVSFWYIYKEGIVQSKLT